MISTENVSPVDVVDRERHAVERDRAFGAMKRISGAGARSVSRAMSGRSSRATSFGDAVDMAGDDVAAELVADLQRPFEIEPRAVPASGRRW